jgi:hypothetical protein
MVSMVCFIGIMSHCCKYLYFSVLSKCYIMQGHREVTILCIFFPFKIDYTAHMIRSTCVFSFFVIYIRKVVIL